MATDRTTLKDNNYYEPYFANNNSRDIEAAAVAQPMAQSNYNYDLSSPQKRMLWTCGAFICGIGLLLSIILIPVSLHSVEHNEYAIRYEGFSKKIYSNVYTEGKYLLTPQTTLFKFSNLVKKMDVDIMCLTLNGIQVHLAVDVEYQMPIHHVYNAFINYGEEHNIFKYLQLGITDSVRDTCGEYQAKEYYEDRLSIQHALEDKVVADVRTANAYYNITSVVLASYDFPDPLEESIREKRDAWTATSVAQNERDGMLVEANTALLSAQIVAEKVAIEADAEVNSVLAEANAQSFAIQSIWSNRQSVYDEIRYAMNITVDRFVFQYLTSVVLLNAEEPITTL